jgi:uncharacterized protein YegL
MNGNPIESVKSGIRALHSELMGDPSAVESTYLSVITFDSNAQQIVPLTELSQFNSPDIRAGGTTAFGAALKLLMDAMEREVRKTTPEQKGDWKPLVFIFTDGEPTDRWEPAADELKTKRPGNVIAVACGDRAVPQALKRVTDNVLIMKDMSPDAFKQFFKWVSASIKQTSSKIGGAGAGGPIEGVSLPPPPEIIIHL